MSNDVDFEVEQRFRIYELKSIMDSDKQSLQEIDKYKYPYDGFSSKKEAAEWLEENTDPFRYQKVVILSTLEKELTYE